jgi:hypothetical protein
LGEEKTSPGLNPLSSIQAVLSANVDPGERMQETKNIQEPYNHDDDHHGIQDRFDRSSHRYVTIYQPEQNTHCD